MANKIKQLKLYKNSQWESYTISPDAADVNLTVAIGATAQNVQDALHTLDAEKAPVNHAYTTSMFGLGDKYGEYGHVKLIDNLNSSSYADGAALSAYQGYVLNDAIAGKAPKKHASSTYDEYGVATASNYGHALVKNGVSTVHSTGQALSAYQGYLLDNKIEEKAPIYHPSQTSQYGLSQKTWYGHTKLVDNLNSSAYTEGQALSAHQGYVLKDNIDGKAPTYHTSTTTNYGVGTPSSYGHVKILHSPQQSYVAGEALSAYGAKNLTGCTTFACTRQTQSIQSTSSGCTGIYDKGSKTVRIMLSFNATATSVKITTATYLFLIPQDYRPSSTQYGHGFIITSAINSGFSLNSSAFVVNTNGYITQRLSANTNKGFGIIEYVKE